MAPDDVYPCGRMIFHLGFLMALGTIYAYSTWSPAFVNRSFPDWTSEDLGFVYSMGIFGAFATPFGGMLYDKLGPTATYVIGLALTLLGICGITAASQPGWLSQSQARYVVGLCYYLEEQGSSTLYMGIAMDTLVHFPAKNVSVSMGLVALGYGLSAVLMSFIVSSFQPSIIGLFWCLGVVLTLFCLMRVFLLGDFTHSGWQQVDEKEAISPSDALRTAPFRQLIIYSLGCLVPCTVLLSLLKSLGDAGGIDGSSVAQVALISNCFGRIVVGCGYDYYRDVPSHDALLIACAGITAGFGILLQSLGSIPSVLLWVGCVSVTFLFGGSAPLVGAFVKDHFPSSSSGTIFGLHQVSIAFGNLLWALFLGPTSTSESAGFIRPVLGAFVLSGVAVATGFPDYMARLTKHKS